MMYKYMSEEPKPNLPPNEKIRNCCPHALSILSCRTLKMSNEIYKHPGGKMNAPVIKSVKVGALQYAQEQELVVRIIEEFWIAGD